MDDGGLGSNGTLNLHTDSYTLSRKAEKYIY